MALTPKVIVTWLVVFALSYFVLAGMIGLSQGVIPALGLATLIAGLVAWYGKIGMVDTGLSKKTAPYAAIIGVFIVAVYMGFLGSFGITETLFSPLEGIFQGTPAASVSGGQFSNVQAGVASSSVVQACRDLVGTENFGKSATVTINAYDKESLTPFSAAVDGKIHIEDVGTGEIISSSDTTAYSLQSFSVGDVINIYGGSSSSYYVDDLESVCIKSAAFPVNLDAHAVAARTSMQLTGYDDTGSATLSGGTNSSQEDYDITLGANGDDTFFVKVKVNAAVKSFNLMGLTMASWNDISDCYPTGSGWREQLTENNVKNMQVQADDAGTASNYTGGYEDTFVLSNPVLLREWESMKYEFKIEAGTTDPATTQTFASQDACVLVIRDAVWERGADGNLNFDIHVHDTAGTDVGLVEEYATPIGKTTGLMIEGI